MTDQQAAREVERIAEGLAPSERADLLCGRWYLASCDGCEWVGSSRLCGIDFGWDDSNVYCPKCYRSGCDMGAIGQQFDAAIRAHLQTAAAAGEGE